MFVIITYTLNQKTISSHQNYAKIINTSGKQRMLSQKLLLLARNYIVDDTDDNRKQLQSTIDEIKSNHKIVLSKLYTHNLNNIFYKHNLDKDLKSYIFFFEKLIISDDRTCLEKASKVSQDILSRLDNVVKEYETYAGTQLQKMENYEFSIMCLTLIVLFLEVIFIFRPASKKLEQNRYYLKKTIEEQTKKLQESIDIVSKHVIFSRTDLRGVITEVSEAFCKICEYSPEELIGKPHNIVRHKDMPASAFEDVWNTIKSGKEWRGEVKNSKKNGGYYWVYAIITPEFDEDGNIKSYMAIRYDITAKKDFEKQTTQLMQAEKLATLGEMIGNIAHQWRQPLSAISSTASSMKMQHELGILDNDDIPEHTQSIMDKASYLSETINTFRDFIKNEKKYKDLVIQDEMKQAINITLAVLKDAEIDFVDNIDYDVPIQTKMVSGELPQVIVNIINNAKDILIEKEIKNSKIIISLISKDDKAIITIEDNAGGIPESIIDRIFEPYFTTKHQAQGTGLGLHMSYQIITESLGGNLYAQNSDIGAKFYIELPLNQS
jgi:PAS domain S-box-containing protein